MTVSVRAKMEGISEATLYNSRKQTRLRGRAVPGPKPNNTDRWSAEAKLATVRETAPLNEARLNEYCREELVCRAGQELDGGVTGGISSQ